MIYRIETAGEVPLTDLQAKLAANQFTECMPSQESSCGWVPPRAENGAMVEAIGGHWIFRLQSEVKAIPAAVLKRRVKKMAADIEKHTGQKPGRKLLKELAEDAKTALMPMAFSKITQLTAWFDIHTGLLVLDTASAAAADGFVTQLVRGVDGLQVMPVNTVKVPADVMEAWLLDTQDITDAARQGFAIGSCCELERPDELKAKVRWDNLDVNTDVVRGYLKSGFTPTKLELIFGGVQFILTDAGTLQKLDFGDVVPFGGDYEDMFDADVVLMTGAMAPMIRALIQALGGEVVRDGGAV